MSVTFCAVPPIMLCTGAITSLSVSIKALYAVVFALYLRSFGHRIVFQEICVNLAKFALQGLENCKILCSKSGLRFCLSLQP